MIDSRESLLTLAEAGELVGKHVATIYRWASTGVRGAVLEVLQVGGTRCTSREALQRFCERFTETPQRASPSGALGSRASQRAGEELRSLGV